MIPRSLAVLLVASSVCSLASADVSSAPNPKTRSYAYRAPALKAAPASSAEQKKQIALAQLKNGASAPSGAATLGGLQAGSPSSFPSTLALGGNDSCATPDPISGTGTFFFDNSAATTGSQGQAEALCLSFGQMAIANDVWFVWTAPQSGTATMTLCGGTGMDSKIAAYAGATCPAPGSAIACNDDSCGLQSSMSFPVNAGGNYMLQLGNYFNASPLSGTFTMNVIGGAPSNDNCASAIAISGAGPFNFDTTGATTSAQQSGSCPTAGQDIWYAWTAPSSGTATLSLCGSSFDSIIAVYAGAGCPAAGTAWCNDDSCALQSAVTFPCTAGAVYELQLGGYNANSGPGSFTLNVVGGGPSNDNCASAIAISGAGPFVFDTTGATTSAQQSGTCGTAGQDVWYQWTATGTGVATLSLCGTSFDTIAAVYAGAGCPAGGTNWCNDDFCAAQSQVSFPCAAGSVFTLQIGGFTAASGPGSFTLSVNSAVANDDCATPTAIAGNGVFAFDNTLATTGTQGQAEPNCLFFATTGFDNDVWFRWTPSSTGNAVFSMCGLSGMDSKIAAYAGSSCPTPGSVLACNDDSCVLESEVTFPVTSGSTYLLQLGNFPGALGAAGFFSLDVPGGTSGVAYLCDPGTGGVIVCPCANPPTGSGRGCNNSAGTGGASIVAAGSNALATPTLVLTTAGEKPTATTILLQGNGVNPAGLNFGQGVRCATGLLKRLYTRAAVGGSISVPNFGGGDPSIPVRSAALGDPILAGQTRWYVAYYRDPIVLGGCSTSATYNSTNSASVLWQ
ncbi:MAG: hypothetical protein IPJ19_00065 [Planctomycetes bacterium]|nr:hypothetical protein [Planctomycetota bacterium]